MTAISISLSGVTGVDCPRWQRLATEFESPGFAGFYRYDQFVHPLHDFQSLVRSLATRASSIKGVLNLWLLSRSMNFQA